MPGGLGAADPDAVVENLRRMIRLAKANRTVPILGTILRHFSSPVAESVIGAVNARLPAAAWLPTLLDAIEPSLIRVLASAR